MQEQQTPPGTVGHWFIVPDTVTGREICLLFHTWRILLLFLHPLSVFWGLAHFSRKTLWSGIVGGGWETIPIKL